MEQLTDEEWEVYITHSDWNIRFDTASHRGTPTWVLERLANDEDIWVQYAILDNPNTTSEILDQMMDIALFHKYSSLPHAIYTKPKCSEKTILKYLSYNKLKDHLKNWHRDALNAPVMPYNTLIDTKD